MWTNDPADLPVEPPAFGGPGGAAGHTGTNLETALATLAAAVGLAEQPHVLGDIFPAGPPVRIGGQQHWPIDDVVVWFPEAIAWVQSKATLNPAELKAAVSQFLGQARFGRGRSGEPFEALRDADRLIIAYEQYPKWAPHAMDVLDRLRDGTLVVDEITQGSGPGADAYARLVSAVRAADGDLEDSAILALLRRIYFHPTVRSMLRISVRSTLSHVVAAGSVAHAEDHLYRLFDDSAERRAIRDVASLRAYLVHKGCALLAAPHLRTDVDLLLSESGRAVEVKANSSAIITAEGTQVHLPRAVTAVVIDAVRAGNVIVAGPAGEGKSVVLRDAAMYLRAKGDNIIFLEADGEQPPFAHTLAQIFEGWEGSGYIFIDGFDSLRLGRHVDRFRQLIDRLRGSAWHVAIASRDYDMARDSQLRKLFPAVAPITTALQDTRFPGTAIVRVQSLNVDEITQLRAKSGVLDRLFATAPPALAALLTNPFNLSIAASLTEDVDLSCVRDRAGLLDEWWDRRVATGSSEAESVLRVLVSAMIWRRSLSVATSTIDAYPAMRDALLSLSVLSYRNAENQTIGFRHAAIFDYAVERLALRGQGASASLLIGDPDAFAFILPSLRAHFATLYDRSPRKFLAELDALFAPGTNRATLLTILAQIPIARLRDAKELEPLLDGDATHRRILRHIVSAALYRSTRGIPLVGASAPPFADLALLAAQRIPLYAHDAAQLVDAASKGTPTDAQGRALAEAASLIVGMHLGRALDHQELPWFARVILPGFMRTIDFDPEPALALLEQLVAPDRIAQVGQHELFALTNQLDRTHDPRALAILYRCIFADVALPAGMTGPIRPNVALNLIQDNKQILGLARDALARRFADFLAASPLEGVAALCAVARANGRGRYTYPVRLMIAGVERRLLGDGSDSWEDMHYHDHDDWRIVTKAFEDQLRTELAKGDNTLFIAALSAFSADDVDLVLWRILIRAAAAADQSARALLPIVAQRGALLARDLEEPIKTYLASAYARLSEIERMQLDAALFALPAAETNPLKRAYVGRLVARYIAEIPSELATNLRSFRTDDVPSEHGVGAHAAGESALPGPIPDAAEPATQPAPNTPLATAIEDADTALANVGGGLALMPQIHQIAELLAADPTPPAIALFPLTRLVYHAVRLELLSPAELRALTPLVIAAGTIAPPRPTDDDESDNRVYVDANQAAAEILPFIYRKTHDERILEVIDALAVHYDPRVRYTIVERVLVLGSMQRDRYWSIAERAVHDDAALVARMAGGVFDRLLEEDEERAWKGRFAVYDHFARNVQHDDTISEIHRLVEWVLGGNAAAAARLDATLADPWATPEHSKLVVFGLIARAGPPTNTIAALTPRIVALIDLLRQQLQSALDTQGSDLATYPQPERARTDLSIELLVEIARGIQLHSGLSQDLQSFDDTGSRVTHFAALVPILEALASVPLPHTGYYIVRLLNGAIRSDPAGVLALGTRAILTSVRAGLAADSFGQTDVRDFLLEYIDDHRHLLGRNRDAFKSVMDVVDAFAEIGWPEWIDVAFALDAIYGDEPMTS